MKLVLHGPLVETELNPLRDDVIVVVVDYLEE
jgi:hypothetical protein